MEATFKNSTVNCTPVQTKNEHLFSCVGSTGSAIAILQTVRDHVSEELWGGALECAEILSSLWLSTELKFTWDIWIWSISDNFKVMNYTYFGAGLLYEMYGFQNCERRWTDRQFSYCSSKIMLSCAALLSLQFPPSIFLTGKGYQGINRLCLGMICQSGNFW